MRIAVRTPALLAAGGALVALALRTAPLTARPAGVSGSGSPAAADLHAAEIARIRGHFDTVLAELRAADIGHLDPAQRAARARRIAELDAYRDRGTFPHNHDVSGRVPIFVDHRGVRCAVGHLLAMSGRRDIVERVSSSNNLVRVPELAGDTAFVRWLEATGLTLAEAARIQPKYDQTPEEPQPRPSDLNTAGAVLAGTAGLASILLNAYADDAGGRTARGAIGVAIGGLGLGIAASRLDYDGEAFSVGVATGLIGLTSSLVGLNELLTARNATTADGAGASRREPVTVTLSPVIEPRGGRTASGMRLNVVF